MLVYRFCQSAAEVRGLHWAVTAFAIFSFSFYCRVLRGIPRPTAAVISTSRDTLKIRVWCFTHRNPDRSAEIPGYTSATVPGDEPAAAERPAAPCAELRVTSRLWEASDFLGHSNVAVVRAYGLLSFVYL